MASRSRIERVAFIGWRGIDYEELALDPHFTGLTGNSGAGKTTLVMCLNYALLPDRMALDVRPIADVLDPHAAGVDPLAARIDDKYGYAYVVLDIRSRHDRRLLAGIHVRIADGRGEFSRFTIEGLSDEMPLQDVMRIVDGDEELYPDLPELRRSLAARSIDLVKHDKVGDYGHILYEAGILPTDLFNRHDRTLYGKLVETAFRGGITAEVARTLKDYLLAPAKRIPEAVSKLQECTDQVQRTRRELADAGKELELLEATYGAGKAVVSKSLGRLAAKLASAETLVTRTKSTIEAKTKTAQRLSEEQPRIEVEIKTAEESLKNLTANKQLELRNANETVERASTTEQSAKATFQEAEDKYRKIATGEDVWKRVAAQLANRDFQTVNHWIKDQIAKCVEKIAEKNLIVQRLQKETARLGANEADPRSSALAHALQAQTLAEVFDSASESEARSVEMALGGLTAGVVGVGIDALTNLAPNEEFPDLFWMGENPPRGANPREVGGAKWYVCPSIGGYVVSSKHRPVVFGQEAREARNAQIEADIRALEGERERIRTQELQGFTERQEALLRNGEQIEYFLANRAARLEIEDARKTTKEAYQSAKSAHKAAKEAYELIAADMASFSQPYQKAIANLQSDLENGKRDARQLAGELKAIVPQLNKEEADARELLSRMKAVREILGDVADRMLAEAGDVASENEAAYIRDLTQRLSVIGRALENEPAERLTTLAKADPSDEVSCARIWPALIEILKDRISADLIDRDGADLLRDMRDRRAGLESRLHGDEDNVKNQARHVYQAIHSEISSQVRKITALNRLGESLIFGNVVGIRIRAERRQELLKTLEEFADQRSLFRNMEDERRPLEEVLSEFFRDALDLKMEGKELLDYRTYMDLAIEARRHDRKWTPAASLSGGESVGCGLAISLMLFRSLAERGEVRASDITPLFAIDEMQRLDGDGQKVVAEFCERENIQVVVTAPELSPQYRCTLYALARVFDPTERLIVRGLRGQHDSAKVAAVATLS